MFGFGVKGKANNLLKEILRFSKILSEQKQVFPHGTNIENVECVLVGMACFLVVGFAQDERLAYELVPTYQRKIMPLVSKAEYDFRTNLLQEYYSAYRDDAIHIQETQTAWLWPMIKSFSERTARYFEIEPTNDACTTIGACIVELINTINPKLNL